ncbi:phosphoadenylyl-sulfate reductase [Actomonas aquatica]|uniref:Phosphoadenosine 5'-phosphosulfate reductase n=1 Tax=Actomonas aquatica TaxID=2866162 RepID=A0ABZ1CC34_9BACT|nr:phosphoadenylyl-sulfate reductase [Opitutus sp. WL0086]WRQ89249.1 phosphoadenylyl-sulfate reductase [Opitutus sp. WL0086]
MSSVALTSPEIDAAALEALDAAGRVRWAADAFGDGLILTTSFGVQSAVMLHLVTQVVPDIPVVFIDTGYLFPETYRFADELEKKLKLNLQVYTPRLTAARQEALYGKRWEQGVEGLKTYNLINKVEPMDRAVRDLGAVAWLAGLRRSQASTREQLPVAQQQNKVTKVHPIIDWDNRTVHRYLTEHGLPYHPLWEQGYVSLGDWHSSAPLTAGMNEEDTRFGGLKRECGLHELSGQPDFQI